MKAASLIKRVPLEAILIDGKKDSWERLREVLRTSNEYVLGSCTHVDFDYALERLFMGGVDVAFLSIEKVSSLWIKKLHKLKERCPSLPIVTFGSSEVEPLLYKTLAYGAVDYLHENSSSESVHKSLRASVDQGITRELDHMHLKLKDSHESLSKVVNQCGDGIFIVDDRHRLRFANQIMRSEFCFGSTDGDRLLEKLSPWALRKEEIHLKTIGGDEKVYIFETSRINWDGCLAVLGSLRDITHRYELEARKDYFLSVVSHDFRTPLTIIREGVCQIQDKLHGNVTPRQCEILETVHSSVDRLNAMIHNLLDLAKIEASATEIDWNLELIQDLLVSVLEPIKLLSEKKGLSLKYNIPEEPLLAYVGKEALFQILNNLLGNALKFTEVGEISVSLKVVAGGFLISVSDSGPGIDLTCREQIFDRFCQGRSLCRREGIGLGLTIVKRLTELHGGSVEVKSELGRGSEFFIRLPRLSLDQTITKLLTGQPGRWRVWHLCLTVCQEPSRDEFERSVRSKFSDSLHVLLRTTDGISLIVSEDFDLNRVFALGFSNFVVSSQELWISIGKKVRKVRGR